MAQSAMKTGPESDPWEDFNRNVYTFNETADYYLAKPIAESYKWVMPTPAFRGVNNFFNNLTDIPSTTNALLQAKPKNAGISVIRFVINTTIGFFGVFDVATQLGIEREKEDFAQTLAVWGVPSGPYIQLPILGPSTVRGAVGRGVDFLMDPVNVDDSDLRLGLYALELIDLRAELLEADALVSGDRYSFIRDAYLQNREYLINDGNVIDNFGDDDFEDDWLDDE